MMLTVLVFFAATLATPAACPTQAAAVQTDAFVTGWPTSTPEPTETALRLNLEAAALYKQRRFNEAAAKYNAALAADPSFLAPHLNLASVLVRQDKYTEATAVLTRMLPDGFVPWYQQAREATDLFALWARPEHAANLNAAAASAGRSWGAKVIPGVLMLARLKPVIRLAPQDGTSPLYPQQEIVSWNPHTGRFHQVTAHNGRVLAFARAPTANKVVFVTAEKLQREAGKLVHFEGVTLHVLDLQSMQSAPPQRINGSVKRVELGFDQRAKAVALVTPQVGERTTLAVEEGAGVAARTPPRFVARAVLTTAGVGPTSLRVNTKDCAFVVSDNHAAQPAAPRVRPRRGAVFALPSRFGLSLAGLPIADLEPASP